MTVSLLIMKSIVLVITLAAYVAAGPISIRPVHPVFAKWNRDSKIVGGEEAVPHSRPYQAAVFIAGSFCGGSLISPNWVLTAAHCAKSTSPAEVLLGAHNINIAEDSQVMITGYAPIVHPRWNIVTVENDIALIKLLQSVPINRYIGLAALAPRNAGDYALETAVASGWGKVIDGTNDTSDVLRIISETILSNTECQDLWGLTIYDSMVCLNAANGKSTCMGDSGGPLTVDNVQVGITSFGGKSCEVGGIPAVFTRVSKYIDWIILTIIN